MSKIITEFRALANFLSRPVLLFYALPWLMLLLVLGTVAQRYIGLYQSQKLFFGSFIFWIGFLPLPGAYAAIGIIALGLCAKLVLKSPLKKHNAGIIIAHFSVLVLLVGGLVTAFAREEGYIMLGGNETSHLVSDYHSRELAVIKNGVAAIRIPAGELHTGKIVQAAELPFSLAIEKYCYQCRAVNRDGKDKTLRGIAAKFDIFSASPEKEEEKNQSGAVLGVKGSGGADGTYLTYQALAEQPRFVIGKDTYQIMMRQAERALPFALRLIKFEKSEYPGTNVARSYRSEVEVIDDALKWNTVIEMNQPLRYRGYTVYQSSFVENEGKLFTVLAVVKNSGELFPYLAVASLCIGLIIHLVIIFSRKKSV